MKPLPKISAIIVAVNEELLIRNIITELRKQVYSGDSEIILADGGSTDQTVAFAKQEKLKIARSPKRSKSIQMNTAAAIATGDILFFVHVDMTFDNNTFSIIQKQIATGFAGGGFSNVFDNHNQKIKTLGNWFNFRIFNKREQSDKGLFYGDNGIFVKRNVFNDLQGFKEIPIMEDYDFSKRLQQKYSTTTIKEPKIIVSARRHIKAGFIKTRFQWVVIRTLYKWGVSPFILEKWYRDIR
ncbi:MAG: glycosyltransferase involved in cell wall biosynthesis [Polaribacter sp.]|jgi:glycosyltransferase involved in cell wall biosynthesis